MAKKKKGGRGARGRPAPPVLTTKKTNYWWWVAMAAVAVLGVALIVFARQGTKRTIEPPPGVESFENEPRTHTDQPVDYERQPPTGGAHADVWLNCGIYDREVPDENAVHSLEHGAVWIGYRPDITPDEVGRLRGLARDKYSGQQRYVVLSPYPGLDTRVAAVAWGKRLKVDDVNDGRIGQFVEAFQARPGVTPEVGGACTGGVGQPVG